MSALAMLDGALCFPYGSCTEVPTETLVSTAWVWGLLATDAVLARARRALWRIERRLQQRWGLYPEGRHDH